MTTIPTQRSVVACVAERDPDEALVTAAIDAAKAHDARLIFYVHDSVRRFGRVRPTFWSADVARPALMTALELEVAGEHESAVSVVRARAQGLDAYGFLAERRGPAGLRAAAEQQRAEVVVVRRAEPMLSALRAWAGAGVDRTVVVS